MRGVVLLALGAAAAYAAMKYKRGQQPADEGADAETWAPPALDEPGAQDEAPSTYAAPGPADGASSFDPPAGGPSANGESSADTESTST